MLNATPKRPPNHLPTYAPHSPSPFAHSPTHRTPNRPSTQSIRRHAQCHTRTHAHTHPNSRHPHAYAHRIYTYPFIHPPIRTHRHAPHTKASGRANAGAHKTCKEEHTDRGSETQKAVQSGSSHLRGHGEVGLRNTNRVHPVAAA